MTQPSLATDTAITAPTHRPERGRWSDTIRADSVSMTSQGRTRGASDDADVRSRRSRASPRRTSARSRRGRRARQRFHGAGVADAFDEHECAGEKRRRDLLGEDCRRADLEDRVRDHTSNAHAPTLRLTVLPRARCGPAAAISIPRACASASAESARTSCSATVRALRRGSRPRSAGAARRRRPKRCTTGSARER